MHFYHAFQFLTLYQPLSEETPNAGNVIPKAIFLTALIGGLIFIAVSYFLQLYFPDISRFKNLAILRLQEQQTAGSICS